MTTKRKNVPENGNRTEKNSTRKSQKKIDPDELVLDINQQNKALDRIIKKFGRPVTDKNEETGSKVRAKSRGASTK
jgi:hypothetical protein